MIGLEKLIGLEDFIVEEIIEEDNKIIFSGHLKRKEQICPRC